jgi:chromosome segregation protein
MGQARADAARRLVELEAHESNVREELDAAATALAEAQEAARAAEAVEIELRNAEIEASEAVRRAGSELAASETAVIDADRRATAAREAMERATHALGQLELIEPGTPDQIERRAEIAEQRLTRDRARLDEANAALDDRTAQLRGVEQRQREAAADAQRLLPDAQPTDHVTLADGLRVEPGLERAVAGALGAYADAPVAGDPAQAHGLVEGGAGAVVVPAPPRPQGPAPQGARPLREAIVACPAERRPHIERLLADVWLVDDVTRVPAEASGAYVDRDGVVFRPSEGTVSTSRGAWARHALHERALEAQQSARAEAVRLERLVGTATEVRDAARRRLAATERSASRIRERLAGERAAAAARAERLERMRAEVEGAEHAQADAERAGQAARRAIAELATALEAAQSSAESARERAHEGGAELERRRANLREARSTLAVVDARTAEVQAQAAAARALVGAADTLPADLALVSRAAAALTGAADRLGPLAQQAATAVAAARETFTSAEARLTQAQREAEAAEAAAGESREQLHSAEVKLRLAEERAAEAGPPPDSVPEEPLDPDEVATRLADLERRRLGIGAVNELAASERSELAEREQHIAEQVADLEKSSASLRAHLGELDTAVGEGFEAIFQSVSERFSEVVGLLFPDGTGRLRLVEPEEEDGDEGVEVEVIPGGKRARAMSLMSGGERSLIAMAFCLALAMARPAPFYLLDEVEAALDDANLRRFLGVIRRLSDDTQFIVITHQQPTVEVADTLFGVTMGQDGISQVLSRRLAHSIEGPARPYVRRALRLVN